MSCPTAVAASSSAPVTWPFTGRNQPRSLAADAGDGVCAALDGVPHVVGRLHRGAQVVVGVVAHLVTVVDDPPHQVGVPLHELADQEEVRGHLVGGEDVEHLGGELLRRAVVERQREHLRTVGAAARRDAPPQSHMALPLAGAHAGRVVAVQPELAVVQARGVRADGNRCGDDRGAADAQPFQQRPPVHWRHLTRAARGFR